VRFPGATHPGVTALYTYAVRRSKMGGGPSYVTQRQAYLGTPLEISAGSMKLRLNGPMPFTCKTVSPSIHAKW
jgi:hypothetical protein